MNIRPILVMSAALTMLYLCGAIHAADEPQKAAEGPAESQEALPDPEQAADSDQELVQVTESAQEQGQTSQKMVGQLPAIPKKISVDTVGDGKPHRFEYYDGYGTITKVEIDSFGDGVIDEVIMFEKGKPVTGWKDTKRSGKPNVWIEYQ